MRPPKFNFVPERLLEKQKSLNKFFYASILTNGQIIFGKNYIDVYELNDKFMSFYIDKEKRTLGFRILEGNTELEELNGARQLKSTPVGSIKLSITKLLHQLGWEKGQSYKKIPIEIYKSQTMSGEIHYCKLPDLYLNNYERKDS